MRNEVIVDVRVVRKSVQQHESRSVCGKVADIQVPAIAPDAMFGESGESGVLGVRHGCPLGWWEGFEVLAAGRAGKK